MAEIEANNINFQLVAYKELIGIIKNEERLN